MTPIETARSVQVLISQPWFADAMKAVRNRLSGQWETATDPAKREQLWHVVQAQGQLISELQHMAAPAEEELRKTNAEQEREAQKHAPPRRSSNFA